VHAVHIAASHCSTRPRSSPAISRGRASLIALRVVTDALGALAVSRGHRVGHLAGGHGRRAWRSAPGRRPTRRSRSLRPRGPPPRRCGHLLGGGRQGRGGSAQVADRQPQRVRHLHRTRCRARALRSGCHVHVRSPRRCAARPRRSPGGYSIMSRRRLAISPIVTAADVDFWSIGRRP
jgi:hypothetical protein